MADSGSEADNPAGPHEGPPPTMSDMQMKMKGMPTVFEMVGPPFILVAVIILALLIYSGASQPRWWRHVLGLIMKCGKPCHSSSTTSNTVNQDIQFGPKQSNGFASDCNATYSPDSIISSQGDFHNPAEEDLLNEFSRFQNRPTSLLLLSLPTVLSLAFCPAALFLHKPMVEFFWPFTDFPTAPNVNDAISSFLVPAGLVYAIAFGFAYQEAVARQNGVFAMVTSKHGLMEQILVLTSSCGGFTTDQKLRIQQYLKTETLAWIQMFMRGKKATKAHRSFADKSARYREVLAQFHGNGDSPTSGSFKLDYAIKKKVFDQIIEINGLTSETASHSLSTMNFLQWAFLESLGFFAFFGILMLEGESYRLELTMCMLTVFSISLFTYVLADLDQPFHGVFRIDLDILSTFIRNLECEWKATVQQRAPKQDDLT